MILTQRDSSMSANCRVIPPQITKHISPNTRRGRESPANISIIWQDHIFLKVFVFSLCPFSACFPIKKNNGALQYFGSRINLVHIYHQQKEGAESRPKSKIMTRQKCMTCSLKVTSYSFNAGVTAFPTLAEIYIYTVYIVLCTLYTSSWSLRPPWLYILVCCCIQVVARCNRTHRPPILCLSMKLHLSKITGFVHPVRTPRAKRGCKSHEVPRWY